MNPNPPPARRRHFLALTADWERKSELVPVLLRITAEPESAYERFNALAYYALSVSGGARAVRLRKRGLEKVYKTDIVSFRKFLKIHLSKTITLRFLFSTDVKITFFSGHWYHRRKPDTSREHSCNGNPLCKKCNIWSRISSKPNIQDLIDFQTVC